MAEPAGGAETPTNTHHRLRLGLLTPRSEPGTVFSVLFQDCNANGVPDECELAAGSSEDCQPNGIPDECDIAVGTSGDCNANGLPDECEAVHLLAAKTWKIHGVAPAAEEFYIALPLESSGGVSPGVETRAGGISKLTFEFDGPPSLPEPATAAAYLKRSDGAVYQPTSAAALGNVLITTWSGIPNAWRYVVCLNICVLAGDGDVEVIGQVGNVAQAPPATKWATDGFDKTAIGPLIGQTTTQANCKYDITQTPPPSRKKIDGTDKTVLAGSFSGPVQSTPVTCP